MVRINFHPHFSDDSVHNVATTFEHMKTFIHWMYENNLFRKGDMIYGTTDGCSKKYRFCKFNMAIHCTGVYINIGSIYIH